MTELITAFIIAWVGILIMRQCIETADMSSMTGAVLIALLYHIDHLNFLTGFIGYMVGSMIGVMIHDYLEKKNARD